MVATWQTLPLGAGGLVTGLHIANDGSMVCRTDVGNIYRWSGLTTDYADPTRKWLPLMTNASLNAAAGGLAIRNVNNDIGGWEHVLAPGSSNVHLAVFGTANNTYGTQLWYSTNSGATWSATGIAFTGGSAQSNADNPGGNCKTSAYKIAIDPANSNVAYCGMPVNSGNTAGAYTSLNQAGGSTLATWVSVKTSGATPVPATSYVTSCGIVIDPSMGTVTVGGQTVTRHIIIPIGGAGIYESKDGGVTFAEIAATPIGTSVFYVTSAGCNFDGVYYCVTLQPTVNAAATASWTTGNSTISMVTNPGIVPGMTCITTNSGLSVGTVLSYVGTTLTLTANAAHASVGSNDTLQFTAPVDKRGVWRWVPGSPGTWTNITAGTVTSPNYLQGTSLIVDPRNLAGSKTYLSVFGFNGIGVGFTSTTANTGTTSGMWGGNTGGQTPHMMAASYDIGYINSIFGQGSGAFTYGTCCVVDANGVTWWGGNQSLFYFGTSAVNSIPLTSPPRYDTTSFPNTYSWSMGRGQESTVAMDVLCPPGGTYPVMALHDIGSPARGTFTDYPLTVAVPFKEYVCANVEYAANDPSCIVARVTSQTANVDASCYSLDYGGTWNALAQYPTSLWPSNTIIAGMAVAVDKDHWVMLPNGFGDALVPAVTANATTTASWALCTGLPTIDWFSEPWFFGTYTPKPLAVGYGADLGTVWACRMSTGNTTATLYRSTNNGAAFSSVLTWTTSANAYSAYCLPVPGFPNELWVTSRYSGGTTTNLWRIANANTATPTAPVAVNLPTLISCPVAFTLGAPASPGGYPTLYLYGGSGFGSTQYLYQGSYPGSGSTVTWTLFGTSGQTNGIFPDLPASCQLAGIQSIKGDWNVYQRLYVASQDSGFAWYGDVVSPTGPANTLAFSVIQGSARRPTKMVGY